MNNILKNIKKSFIITSLLYILFGIILIVFPEDIGRLICYLFGGIIMIFGIINIINYISKEAYQPFNNYSLVTGLICAAVSIIFFAKADFIISIFPFIFGVIIIINSIIKVQQAFDMKRIGYAKWWWVLVFAAVSLVLGIIVVVNPFAAAKTLIIFVGVVFIIDGIADLFTMAKINRLTK